MNHCAIQQNVVVRSRDEMRSSFARDAVFCPKPRRVGLLTASPAWHLSHQADVSDSKGGSELLDIILAKHMIQGGHSMKSSNCWSPPSRVSNPLIKDARFNEPYPSGGNFGNKPAVRIEGFDCLDRDRSRNCSILTLA